ncbi:MAG: glycosyltransferase family 9 protein [Candidatus Tantalella remota]|nr:glycosyltransferase family 9 protein [Candidatus Tantalella remota]
MRIDKSKIKKILLITLSNLGDIILTTPVVNKLHSEFPNAVIDVMCGEPGREVFRDHPAVGAVDAAQKIRTFSGRVKQTLSIRKKRYDLIIDLKNPLTPFLAGARMHAKITFDPTGVRHKVEEHLLKLTGLVDDPLSDIKFFISVKPEEKRYADSFVGGDWKRLVVMNPGAKSHLKRWDAFKFAKLTDMIVTEFKSRVVLVGCDEDREVVGKVVSSVTTPVEDLCSKTSLGTLAGLMSEADLVVTNDSAPLHVASAVNAPTVAIFGPSDEKKYGPLSERHITVTPEVPCRPCEKALCGKGPDEGCISDVDIKTVFAAVKKFL